MSFTASKSYGEYKHLLSKNEMPSHNHTANHYIQGDPGWNDVIRKNLTVMTRYGAYFPESSIDFGSTGYTIDETKNVILLSGAPTTYSGNNESHNNIQPSFIVYFWKRVS